MLAIVLIYIFICIYIVTPHSQPSTTAKKLQSHRRPSSKSSVCAPAKQRPQHMPGRHYVRKQYCNLAIPQAWLPEADDLAWLWAVVLCGFLYKQKRPQISERGSELLATHYTFFRGNILQIFIYKLKTKQKMILLMDYSFGCW